MTPRPGAGHAGLRLGGHHRGATRRGVQATTLRAILGAEAARMPNQVQGGSVRRESANARCISYTVTSILIANRPQFRRVFFSSCIVRRRGEREVNATVGRWRAPRRGTRRARPVRCAQPVRRHLRGFSSGTGVPRSSASPDATCGSERGGDCGSHAGRCRCITAPEARGLSRFNCFLQY